RAFSDRGPVAEPQVSDLHVEFLPSASGRDSDHDLHLRGHDAALYAVREVRADHLDLGAESRRASIPATSRPACARTRLVDDDSMNAIYALFGEPDDVQKAVDGLRGAGVPDDDITVISSEPIEEYEFSHRHHASWLFPIAVAGGAIGLAAGTGITV